jgi:hypothetical protein
MGKANRAPAIPHNGSFVVFSSLATNLTTSTHFENTSLTYNIYRREKDSSVTELISARPDGKAPQRVGGSSTGPPLVDGAIEPAVSDVASDGSFAIAFTSDANDLLGAGNYIAPGNVSLGPTQVYIRIFRPSTHSPATFLVSEAEVSGGSFSNRKTGANDRSDQPTIVRYPSPDGTISHRYTVCFRSRAGDFITADVGSLPVTTIYCLRGIGYDPDGQFEFGDKVPNIAPPFHTIMNSSGHSEPQLSRDESTLAFVSDLNIIPDTPQKTSPTKQVYSLSFPPASPPGSPSLLSVNQARQEASGNSLHPSVSYDGRYTAFIHAPDSSASTSERLKGFSTDLPFFVRHTIDEDGEDEYLQINTTADGTPSNRELYSGRLSDSGQFAIFSETVPTIGGITPNTRQVFFKELNPTEQDPGGPTLMVSVKNDGTAGNLDSGYYAPPGQQNPAYHVALGSFSEGSNRVFLTAFVSFATNFPATGIPVTNAPFIFRSLVYGSLEGPGPGTPTPTSTPTATSTATPQPQPTEMAPPDEEPIVDEPQLLVPNAPISEPPRVEVRATNGGKRFDVTVFCQLFTLDPALGSKAEFLALAAAGARLTYAVEIRKAGSRQRITRTSSRNVVTVRKLDPGRYTVRYRVSAKVGKKTIKTRSSPPATIALSS